ncbi:hypothetical protein GCM10022222_62140 [Amycolatopsis ultiminotia]|uniref:Cupin type-2 domain-containing protein n=1 Tax=Amycolatopsis ultiminotia TaxID=543629 RepID=A0ABP6XRW1_9PSEU
MYQLAVDNAVLSPENGIRIGRWTQYTGLGPRPFGAMWFEVPADGSSAEDVHPETELAIVVDGEATFTVDGQDTQVPTGSAVLLEPGERHTVHARGGAVKVLSIYWIPEPETQP